MSKKTLKRSLALGALMAFVITGSAMAAELNVNGTTTDLVAENDKILSFGGEIAGMQNQNNPWWIKPSYNGSATVSGWSEITYNGTDFVPDQYCYESVFLASGTGNASITLSGIGTIQSDIGVDDNNAVLFFNAFGGDIEVDAKTINISNVNQALRVNLDSNGDSSITLNADDIILSAKRAVYVWEAEDKDAEGSINITANKTLSIVATSDYALGAVRGNEIHVTSPQMYIEGAEGSAAIYAWTDANIDITTNGKADIVGDIWSYEGSEVSVELGEGGSLTGAVETDDNSTTVLDLGTNSTWDASNTTENTITNVNGNGSVIVGEKTMVEATSVSETTTVVASEAYATALADDGEISKADMEELRAKLAGAKNALVNETALTGLTTLSSTGNFVTNANTSNLGIRDMAGLALVAWRAENNDMNKRLGELRNANGEHGVWVRMVRGESEYSTVKNQYNTYQLGYDEKLSTDKSWTVGMALSYTDGESSFAKGSGENNSKGVAFYGSKLNADGSFIDLIAKYARIENEFEVAGGVGGADYDANGYSVSAEYGKRFEQGNGLWIEPQVELTYGKVGSADYVTKRGYKVAQDSMESLVGRLGFSLGKDVKGGNVYARASYLYDFDGETELTFADKVKMDQDFGGGWWEVGVGANINLSKATYIYADVEKTFGGEVDTNWQWNLGVRYSF